MEAIGADAGYIGSQSAHIHGRKRIGVFTIAQLAIEIEAPAFDPAQAGETQACLYPLLTAVTTTLFNPFTSTGVCLFGRCSISQFPIRVISPQHLTPPVFVRAQVTYSPALMDVAMIGLVVKVASEPLLVPPVFTATTRSDRACLGSGR